MVEDKQTILEQKLSDNASHVIGAEASGELDLQPSSSPQFVPRVLEETNDNGNQQQLDIEKMLKRITDFRNIFNNSTNNTIEKNQNITKNLTNQTDIKNYSNQKIDKSVLNKFTPFSELREIINKTINNTNEMAAVNALQDGGTPTNPTVSVEDTSVKSAGEVVTPQSEFVGPIQPHPPMAPSFFDEPQFDSKTTVFEGPTGRVFPKIPYAETEQMKEHNETISKIVPFEPTPQDNLPSVAIDANAENAGVKLEQNLSPPELGLLSGQLESLMGGGIGGLQNTNFKQGAGVNGIRETSSGGNMGGSGRAFLRGGHLPVWRMMIG